MKELKITKGTWHCRQNKVDNVMQSNFLVECTNKVLPIAKVQSDTMNLTEAEANAQLIAEAGTVANECGKTPRELLEERSEFIDIAAEAIALLNSNGISNKLTKRFKDFLMGEQQPHSQS